MIILAYEIVVLLMMLYSIYLNTLKNKTKETIKENKAVDILLVIFTILLFFIFLIKGNFFTSGLWLFNSMIWMYNYTLIK